MRYPFVYYIHSMYLVRIKSTYYSYSIINTYFYELNESTSIFNM